MLILGECLLFFIIILKGALILEHVSEIMADTCNVNTRQKKILNKLQNK